MCSLRFSRTLAYSSLVLTSVLVACAYAALAQETTQTTTTQGEPQQQVSVQRGEVAYVSGNDLVVKDLDSGELKHFVVPDDARATVDGQQLSVHDLKPGMKLQRTITTTTTPHTVTTVRTIQGTVKQVNAPRSVILTLPDGTNKLYQIPKDQKFTINGKETDAFELRPGMKISATVVTEAPGTVVAEQKSVTGETPTPTPPPTPPMAGALLIEPARPTPPQLASAKPGPSKLPQTGTDLPLLGLLGLLLAGVPFGLRLRRR